MSTFIDALAAGSGPSETLSQTAQTIQNFVSWIASQSSATAGDQSGAVDTVKNHASTWYNSIYPTYLNMPGQITGQGATVTQNLTLLVDLAGQCQAGVSPAMASSIQSAAGKLQQAVQVINQQTTDLGQALQDFSRNVGNDEGTIGLAAGQLTVESAKEQQDLVSLYGQLHHLQSAACPSKKDIHACQDAIQRASQALGALKAGLGLLNAISAQLSSVSQAAGYLSSYWTTVGKDAGNCIGPLGQLTSNPDLITQLNLSGAQQSWSQFLQTLTQASPQSA